MNTREAKKSRTEGMATRSTLTNWFFGALISALSTNQLPTTLDILQYYLFLRESKLKNNYYMLNDKNFVFKRIASEVAEIWKTASIFTIRKEDDIRRKIASEVDKMEYIFSHNTNRRGDDNWIQLKKTEKFPGLFKRSQSDALQEEAFLHDDDVPHLLKKAKLSPVKLS